MKETEKALAKKASRKLKKKDVDEDQAKLVQDEERVTGGVKMETVEGYIMASGGYWIFGIIMATFGLAQLFQVAGTFWLQVRRNSVAPPATSLPLLSLRFSLKFVETLSCSRHFLVKNCAVPP